MKKRFLECGKIVGAHGVRGLVKAESWCDSPKVLAGLKRVYLAVGSGEFEEVKVISSSVMGPLVLLSLDGFSDRDIAIGMRGRVLYALREDIPLKRGQMFLEDMIGLPVIDIDTGRAYGEISDVSDGVRYRIYTVSTESGEVLLPAVDEFVKEIKPDEGVFVRPIPGFFSENEI
jgi:16S rRNA processing protein RimM